MSQRLLAPLLLLALGAAGACPVAATPAEPVVAGQRVRLQLANGDQITGELLWRAEGKLRFHSPLLGDFTLSEADVAIVPIPESLDSGVAAQEASGARRAAATPLPAASPAPVAAAPEATAPWKGKIEVGSVQQTGRTDTLSYNLRAEAEKKLPADTLRANARVLYAEQNDTPSSDRLDASARWRHDLTRRTFTQAQTTYYRDAITEIHSNIEQNVGVGYRVLDGARHTANLGAGFTGQYRDWSAGTNGLAPYAEIFQDYVLRISERVSFIQDSVVQYSPSDRAINTSGASSASTVDSEESNYKLRFNAALQGKFTERVSLNLRFEFELDNAIQTEDARVAQRITSSVGYAF